MEDQANLFQTMAHPFLQRAIYCLFLAMQWPTFAITTSPRSTVVQMTWTVLSHVSKTGVQQIEEVSVGCTDSTLYSLIDFLFQAFMRSQQVVLTITSRTVTLKHTTLSATTMTRQVRTLRGSRDFAAKAIARRVFGKRKSCPGHRCQYSIQSMLVALCRPNFLVCFSERTPTSLLAVKDVWYLSCILSFVQSGCADLLKYHRSQARHSIH